MQTDTQNPVNRAAATPRIAPLSPPYETATDEALNKLMPPGMPPLGLFRTMAKNPELLKNLAANGALVFRSSSLTPLHRETLIQRTCANCGAEYEWGVHAAIFGERVGLTGERLAATVRGDRNTACWTEDEALLIEFADSLHAKSTIDDVLWAHMAKYWNEAQMMELAVVAGFYHAISYTIAVARVQREDFAPAFPKA
jgi:alkylhydroperoxidase family enzyme